MPGTGTTPMLVSDAGKSVMVLAPRTISARPRNSVRVPIVTAIDGSPSLATSTPLSAPPSAPTASAATIASPMGQPWLCSWPMTQPDRPSIEATDRSISPVITMSMSGSAMMAISPMLSPT